MKPNLTTSKLLIISSDRISDWIAKGEVTPRYFNPGNLFDEVHFILLNDEAPDSASLQRLVGRAKFCCYSFPTGIPHFIRTLFWNPLLLKLWARPIVKLIGEIKPRIIRCHGANLNAFVAREAKRKFDIPYIISLHINFDTDVRGRKMGLLKRIRDIAYRQFESNVLKAADFVLPVYRPIVPYLERIGVTKYQVAYNFLNIEHLVKKENYELHTPIRIVSVGRQFKEKNPENLIRAVAQLPNTELTLVGDGNYHEKLKKLAEQLNLSERVFFRPAMGNDELCQSLPEFDIFATHSEYWEISKSVLEPLLSGLPVILNQRLGDPVPELQEGICLLVENSVEGYLGALTYLIKNSEIRAQMGRSAYQYAREKWAPEKTEAAYTKIYQEVLNA